PSPEVAERYFACFFFASASLKGRCGGRAIALLAPPDRFLFVSPFGALLSSFKPYSRRGTSLTVTSRPFVSTSSNCARSPWYLPRLMRTQPPGTNSSDLVTLRRSGISLTEIRVILVLV